MEQLTYTLFTPDTTDCSVESSGHSSGLAIFSRAHPEEAQLYIATHSTLHHTHLFSYLLDAYPELRKEREQWDGWGVITTMSQHMHYLLVVMSILNRYASTFREIQMFPKEPMT